MFDDEGRGCFEGRRGRRERVRRGACTYSTTASTFLFLSLTLFLANAIFICLLHGREAIVGVHARVLRLGRLGAMIVQGAYIFRLGAPLCGNDLGHLRLGRFGLAERGRGQILEFV
jgi:hypothetical protein